MISIDGQMIGKPRDEQHALAILKSLDGRVHSVRTGVCLLDACGKEELFSVETQLEFGKNGEGLLQQYVSTGEPMCAESNFPLILLTLKGPCRRICHPGQGCHSCQGRPWQLFKRGWIASARVGAEIKGNPWLIDE